jgi:hypothetical protein
MRLWCIWCRKIKSVADQYVLLTAGTLWSEGAVLCNDCFPVTVDKYGKK